MTCAHCGALLDDMNTDAIEAVTAEGDEVVWCGIEHFLAWKSAVAVPDAE